MCQAQGKSGRHLRLVLNALSVWNAVRAYGVFQHLTVSDMTVGNVTWLVMESMIHSGEGDIYSVLKGNIFRHRRPELPTSLLLCLIDFFLGQKMPVKEYTLSARRDQLFHGFGTGLSMDL